MHVILQFYMEQLSVLADIIHYLSMNVIHVWSTSHLILVLSNIMIQHYRTNIIHNSING